MARDLRRAAGLGVTHVPTLHSVLLLFVWGECSLIRVWGKGSRLWMGSGRGLPLTPHSPIHTHTRMHARTHACTNRPNVCLDASLTCFMRVQMHRLRTPAGTATFRDLKVNGNIWVGQYDPIRPFSTVLYVIRSSIV
jgi:hypothetical protein